MGAGERVAIRAAASSLQTGKPCSRAAFFDLDRTLVPGSSLYPLARELRAAGLLKWSAVTGLALRQAAFRRRGETEGSVERARVTALALARGHEYRGLMAIVRDVVEQRLLPTVFPSMRDLIRCHQQLGDATYVVTAAPIELASLVASHLGMTGAYGTIAGVGPDGRLTGELVDEVVRGPMKGEVVRRAAVGRGHNLRFSSAYGDSIRDLPMLEAVGFPQVVNPDRRLRQVAVDRGWPILHA
ncbi:MAG TPA: HAD-IB family hydrolase [Acidimicrobiales bacterium]|nr:HAD-IB family hydrolase [Acidimicrobiales bacterium]